MGVRVRRAVFAGGDFKDTDLRVEDGVGVVINIDTLHVGLAFLEVEMFDVVLLAAVNVNGFFVKENQGAGEIHFTDDGGRSGDVDDHEIVAGNRAKADGIGGIGF